MKIEPFCLDDIVAFLKLAAAENWVTGRWELAFLLSEFPQGCFAARTEQGEIAGFVTSVKHDRSGWIGNLIVAEPFRGKGVGEALFRKAAVALQDAGVRTTWLTASKAGKSLYEKHGFSSIDTMVRWIGRGTGRTAGCELKTGDEIDASPVNNIDTLVWDDRRDSLLAVTVERGRLFVESCGFLVIQPCGAGVQFGPFAAQECGMAEQLLVLALQAVPTGTTLYLDSPASNYAAMRFFSLKGMTMTGSNELMYAGVRPLYRPDMLYGLATMGGCG